MRTGRNLFAGGELTILKSRSLGYAHWPELDHDVGPPNWESRSLGYAHWPELGVAQVGFVLQSRSLGYAHWPELQWWWRKEIPKSRSLGYAHWPELCRVVHWSRSSLDHWDMRTGRNITVHR